MSLMPVQPIGMDVAPSSAISPTAAPRADFLNAIGDHLTAVDSSLRAAESQLTALASGQDVALHDVMIVMEEARMNMTLLVEVRNRVVEAYQELTRMQL